jgi:hypothetical protein
MHILITNECSFVSQAYRKSAATVSGPSKVQKAPPTEPAADRKKDGIAPPAEEAVVIVKEEPVDPLNMDLEEEAQIDLEVTASQLNRDVRMEFFQCPELLADVSLGIPN